MSNLEDHDREQAGITAMHEHDQSREKMTLPATGSLAGKFDPDGQNEQRASWALQTIHLFQRATGTDDEDALADLLCDLMHWCDRNGESFRLELGRAVMHYEAETSEEG